MFRFKKLILLIFLIGSVPFASICSSRIVYEEKYQPIDKFLYVHKMQEDLLEQVQILENSYATFAQNLYIERPVCWGWFGARKIPKFPIFGKYMLRLRKAKIEDMHQAIYRLEYVKRQILRQQMSDKKEL